MSACPSLGELDITGTPGHGGAAEEDTKDGLKRRDSKKRSDWETQKDKDGRRRERRDSEQAGRSTRDAKDAAAYGPEFLRAFAVSSGKDSQFDVFTGDDAARFTRRFVWEHADVNAAILPPGALATTDSHASKGKARSFALDTATASDKLKQSNSARRILPPVVFALPRVAAGRKVVDFYMSWRGKTKTHPLKGGARRTGFLDAEFKRVRETLDGEWKRARLPRSGKPLQIFLLVPGLE
ncbi:hypothetical protein B0H11DRAFT_2386591 [Mycena galericulata]|nr:hypothetical protein B0H11DRAFT_2386591 [Mycena galericulata]